MRTFKRSRAPQFAVKLVDIVDFYVDPPAHAVVLSIDEKSQIQTLARTQPRLPLKPGRCDTWKATAALILAKLDRLPNHPNESKH